MKKIYFLLSGLFLVSTSAIAETDSRLREEIDQIKNDIVIIQRKIYYDKNDTTAPQESVTNIHVKLGEYDQMIRDMNGKVESIEYRLNALEKKMEMIDKDIDLRFNQMKRQGGVNNTPTPVKSSIHSDAKAPQGVAPKDLYEEALTALKNDKLDNAEEKFSQFLNSYPQNELAGNAQYWLGEVYYKQKNFTKAAVSFKDGYSKYPNGTKGPDCLLKLGLSMKALGKKDEACTAFVNLPTLFEKLNTEISSRAKKEAEALGCK